MIFSVYWENAKFKSFSRLPYNESPLGAELSFLIQRASFLLCDGCDCCDGCYFKYIEFSVQKFRGSVAMVAMVAIVAMVAMVDIFSTFEKKRSFEKL